MRLNYLAMGPALLGCALVALSSCSTDDKEPSPGLAPTISASTAAASAYDIVKVPAAMTIDGNLSEWTNIAAISMAGNSGRAAGLDNTAKVKLAWDDTYLYAAYDVTDTELLALQTTRDHGQIFEDDEVELYVDPQGDGASATSMTPTDYQFLANVREALGDNKGTTTGGKDASYNAPSFLAKVVTNGTLNGSGADVGYTMELRISWADLGVTPAAGNFMRIDPAVGDRDGAGPPPVYAFDWAGLTLFNNPSAWKDVQLVNRPPPTSAYDIVKVSTAMTIDGSLGEWAGIPAISMADTASGWAGKNTAKVKLAWDPTYLYMAYDVTDTDLEALETARDAGNIYKDDEIEFYIDPQGDGWTAPKMTPTDYQFLANILDALGDMRGTATGGKDASFNAPSFLAKAAINGTIGGGADVGYTVEARIAWTDLGVTPAAGNFMRLDPAVGDWDGTVRPATPEAFDWAGITLFNNPSAWKDVKLAVDNTAPAAPTNLALTVVSSSQIDVAWTGSASSDVAKYNIYRATSGTPALYKTVSASPYHDTGLTQGSYTYQVSAVDAAGNESSKTPAKSATAGGASGIPFGLFGLRPDSIPSGTIWTGGVGSWMNLPGVLGHLDAAQKKSPHLGMWYCVTNCDYRVYFKSATDHSFNLQAWKDTLDRVSGPINSDGTSSYYQRFVPYIQDGTLQGFLMLDDLVNYTPPPSFQDVEGMAAHMKLRFPTVTTTVRDRASDLQNRAPVCASCPGGHSAYQYLDVAWSQYQNRSGSADTFRDAQILAAKNVKLGLILGVNITAGMNGTSAVPPDTLSQWGNALLKPTNSDYACGFMMWDITYPDVGAPAMSTLANLAKNHVLAPCKRR